MDKSSILPFISLVIAVAALIYTVRTARQSRRVFDGLKRQTVIGMDAWIAEQVQRWASGELRSSTQKGVGPGHIDAEIIEPIPGWQIVVGTTAHGKRTPFEIPSISLIGKPDTLNCVTDIPARLGRCNSGD
ncbi:MAG: hypothetical protein BGO63_03670 [Candidatus Accumulibacter sp. 66-26]|nr:MAG: hypothetical protein BGO63_03670 [Candidatus Accumulibacter sp. 66-26]